MLVALIAIALTIRIADCAVTAGLGVSPPVDFREYVNQGQRLLKYGTISCPLVLDERLASQPSSIMPPAYSGIVAGAYALWGVESKAATTALQLLNAVATSLAVLFVWLAARKMLSTRGAWVAAILVAINPALFGYTEYIWDTSLFVLGVSITIWLCTLLAARPPRATTWLAFGIWLGALAMLNPALTIAYPVLVLWPAWASSGRNFKPIARATALAIVGWGLAITPWTIRNYIHFDQFIYVRGGFSLELWLGVCPQAGVEGARVHLAQFPLLNETEHERLVAMGEEGYLEALSEQATSAIRNDPVRWVRLIGLRAMDYWFGTLFTHTMPGKGPWPPTIARWGPLLFYSLETLALITGVFLIGRLPVGIRWFILACILFSLTYCILKVQVRFRAPIEPAMALVTAAVLECIWNSRLNPKSRGSGVTDNN